MTTIDTLKRIKGVLEAGDVLCEVTAVSMLAEAIAREEAQPASTQKLQVTLEDRPVDIELAQYKRMFEAACVALGSISEALGLDPIDGGAEPILDAIEELKDAQPSAAVPTGYKPVPGTMVLDSDALRFLHGLSQPDDDGEYSEIRLTIGDGHAGHGLYASIEEYPEEGADIICSFAAAPPAPAKPLTDEQAYDIFGVGYSMPPIRAIEAAHGIKEPT